MQNDQNPWYHGAVVYQIYPRSFYDSNGDGIGDLPGIIEKLDYLAGKPDSLNVNALWLSPFYPSPMADFGYDISDYRGVDPIFGNIDDFKRLVAEAHDRNLHVIIDFVPNHTSDQHPWFAESRLSKVNPKHDWYTWVDPGQDGKPPNNWLSSFGGPAWEFDETRQQFYLHSFLKSQPDLNWDNPDVRQAMVDTMRYWLDLGVDGLRVDAVLYLSKDPEFRDDPPNPNPENWEYATLLHVNSRSGPNLFKYLSEMADVVRSHNNAFMITEAYFDDHGNINNYLDFYNNLDPTVCAPFFFEAIHSDWDAGQFQSHIDAYQSALLQTYEPVYCLSNHDQSRLASRIGKPASKAALVMLLTLPGMPFLYYGDEIGMVDVAISTDQVMDPAAKNNPDQIGLGRDPERTPMQWSSDKYAGFTTATPWLPVAPDFAKCNVEAETAVPESHLNLTKRLLKIRNSSTALRNGQYNSKNLGDGIFAYTRTFEGESLLVLLNFTNQTIQLDEPQQVKEILVSTLVTMPVLIISELQANDAIVARV